MGEGLVAGTDPGSGRAVAGHRINQKVGASKRLGVSPTPCGYNARHSVRSVFQTGLLKSAESLYFKAFHPVQRLSAPSPRPEGETHGTAHASV
ncbi:Protein of unassigned function [Pseudomonas sp. IT-194MI4]